jgi:hypothetical protein
VDILGSEPFTLARQAVQASRFCQEAIFSILPFIGMTLDRLQAFRSQAISADAKYVRQYYEGPGSIPFLLVDFLDAFKRFVLPKEYGGAFRVRAPILRRHLEEMFGREGFSPIQLVSEEEDIMQLAILGALDRCLQESLVGDDTPLLHFIAEHSHIPRYEQVMIRMIKSLHLRDEQMSKAASVSPPTTSVAVDAFPPSATETPRATSPSPVPPRPAKRPRTLADSDIPFSLVRTVKSYGESLSSTHPRIGALVGLSADNFKEGLLSTRSLQPLFVLFSGLIPCEMDGVKPIAAAIREALADETYLGITSPGAGLWYPNALRLLDLFYRGRFLLLALYRS